MSKLKSFFILFFLIGFAAPVFSELPEYAHLSGLNPLYAASLFLPPNPTILEAGAHYSEDTNKMKNYWPDSTIHAFEPYPFAFEQLKNYTANRENIFCYNIALNDTTGVFSFYVNNSGDGASSLLPPLPETANTYKGPCIEVLAMNLDEWAFQNNVDHFDFMWLDMEGAEMKMLTTSPKILSTVKVIYIETNMWRYRKDVALYYDLKPFLESQGFIEVRHWYTAPHGQGNALFVRDYIVQSKN